MIKRKDVEVAALNNPIISRCVKMESHNQCTWEEAMMMGVVTLAGENEQLVKNLVKAQQEKLSPDLLTADHCVRTIETFNDYYGKLMERLYQFDVDKEAPELKTLELMRIAANNCAEAIALMGTESFIVKNRKIEDSKVAATDNPVGRIVAIMGGGDWKDASVEHIEIPSNVNLEEEHSKYRQWYENVYCPEHRSDKDPEYMSFTKWLLKAGATETDKVEEYWEKI